MTVLPEKRLELVHLQLTRNCNLRCWFCGQWGRKGFFADGAGTAMTLAEWRDVIDSLRHHREKSGEAPMVILWGGEPLLTPDFAAVVEYLRDHGFELGMVTNGVLLDRYAELCRESFRTIYVSLDGMREIHDSIRGTGVFDKVAANLRQLRGGRAKLIITSVISPENVYLLPELPSAFAPFAPEVVLLQEMIALSAEEIGGYRTWLKAKFGMEAREIFSWQKELPPDFAERREHALAAVAKKAYGFPVIHLPHGAAAAEKFCLSSFRHLHVTWNGEVMYCTDFYDFSAGNVRGNDLIDIFNNELSDRFRAEIVEGNCLTCNHCAWKNNHSFYLD